MNICMFAKGLPVHIIGGMEIHVQELTEGLIKRGHRVAIITTKHPKGVEKEEKNNLKIYYVGDKPLKYTKEFYKSAAVVFEGLNKRMDFDVVHSQSTSGFGFAKFCKDEIPLVVTLHGTIRSEIKSALSTRTVKGFVVASYLFYKWITSPVDKITLNRSDKIIAVSNELGMDAKRQYKVSEEKLVVIPNGIDINKFKRIEVYDLKEKLKLTDEKIILSVGAIHKQKGYHLLLRILPDILQTQQVKLVIIGTGFYLSDLKSIAKRLNISDKVIFTGRVSDEDLPKYYNLADVCVFPTLRMEGLPLVVPEAMACEKPVIASRIGGIPTAIENNKDGILIEPGNLAELKAKILAVLSDEELAKKLGENARKKVVERLSLDRMVEDTIVVYESVIR